MRESSKWLVVVCVTVVILAIPAVAMQFSEEVNWTPIDFVVMAFLLMLTGAALIAFSHTPTRTRWIGSSAVVIASLAIWMSLATLD